MVCPISTMEKLISKVTVSASDKWQVSAKFLTIYYAYISSYNYLYVPTNESSCLVVCMNNYGVALYTSLLEHSINTQTVDTCSHAVTVDRRKGKLFMVYKIHNMNISITLRINSGFVQVRGFDFGQGILCLRTLIFAKIPAFGQV